jgi:hypothetical protein
MRTVILWPEGRRALSLTLILSDHFAEPLQPFPALRYISIRVCHRSLGILNERIVSGHGHEAVLACGKPAPLGLLV